ncbi:MAG TPA: ABC transporter permease [Planctomycetota bacterium]|nr:ABC transporter permease [Planctomycetota bacterium]
MGRLVGLEIIHRKLAFALGLLAVASAAALVTGGWALLGLEARATARLVAEKETALAARNKDLSDAMREITKRMGFNVVILPRGQNLDDPFSSEYAAKLMPEDYADRLAKAKIVTVNHLLPALEMRVDWPERGGRTIFLMGVKGQVPVGQGESKKPILEPVPKGSIVLGSSLAKLESLAAGDRVEILGERLQVAKVEPRRGDKRDMTAWVELSLLQRRFKKEGLINSIWALECTCALADVGKVREEIQRILPDVEVEEQGEKALARAEARKKAAEVAETALLEEREAHERLLGLGARFRLVGVPLVLCAAGLWLGLLALGNVRERRGEIGVFHALGFSSGRIASVFLARAAVVGLLGAFLGSLAGFGIGFAAHSVLSGGGTGTSFAVPDPRVFFGALVLGPLLSALAAWLPALAAAREDPAAVLAEE